MILLLAIYAISIQGKQMGVNKIFQEGCNKMQEIEINSENGLLVR